MIISTYVCNISIFYRDKETIAWQLQVSTFNKINRFNKLPIESVYSYTQLSCIGYNEGSQLVNYHSNQVVCIVNRN